MTHGGGTVAGESPDKAEQQESSGSSGGSTASAETTPAGGRDPRLSVLREAQPSGTASAVQVDQPTAVFKTLAPRTSEDDAPTVDEAAAEEPAAEEPVSEGPAAEEPVSDEVVEAPSAEAPADDSTESAGAADSADAADEPAEAGGDRLRDAVAAWVASGDEEPSEADEKPAPAESGDAPAAETAEGSWFAARKGAETAEPEAEGDAEPESEGKPEAEDDAEPEGRPETGKSPEAEAGSEDGAEDEPEAVDQPTAVFKAVRPPVVDQPTTALKIPPLPKAPEARESAAEPSVPESPAERTSEFVPLRPDVPRAAPVAPGAKRPEAKAPETKAPEAKAPAAPAAKAPAPLPVPPPSLTEAERTRQQPMPPLPPLDLLAELTNTPPPPPTPLRTTVRRVRIWTPLVILLLIIFAIAQFVRPLPAPVLSLSAAPTFTFAGGELNMPWPTEGQGAAEVEGVGSLGTYGAQKPAPIASVAKTMTAYVILRDHPIKGNEAGPKITVDQKAGEQAKAKDESTAAIKEGQEYTEKQLLQLLMIPSGNNVARLLARWDADSEAAFVEKMNAAAKELGMTDSVYTDPSGLQSTTVSTPQDQLKLARAVMQYDVFREIVNMPNLTVEGIPGQIENNNNILLEPGVSGIKTGSSTPAGGNLLWSANTVIDGKNRRILGVVMGAKDADQLHKKLQLAIDYSLKLIQQAQKDVTSAAVVRKGQVVGYVDDGLGGRTPVIATKELKAIGWPGLKVNLQLTDGGKAVPHAGKAGDVVGQVSIGTGAGKVSAPVALRSDLVEPGFDKKLTRIG
ncbi:serine hydrolase [Streptomyces lateritius]|uniref:Serine hydrolase n=1 Tax=Streptomyces lateritius TaxID=67313 RepID=A0ABW6YKL5_9ACTN